jgi:hypothetical protein
MSDWLITFDIEASSPTASSAIVRPRGWTRAGAPASARKTAAASSMAPRQASRVRSTASPPFGRASLGGASVAIARTPFLAGPSGLQ